MTAEIAFIVAAALTVSFVLTGVVRRQALSRGVLDYPNERSSHITPTPRGGGIATVLTANLAFTMLVLLGTLPIRIFLALVGGGVAIALVGFLDDHRGLTARTRLAVHFAAAAWALFWLGDLPPLQVGDRLVVFGWFGYLLGMLGIVWTLNLFNFMDGIDGIAASEAIFVAGVGAALTGISGAVSGAAFAFASACAGFLIWNWPPARIFMGDVGSGYIGYVIAVLALAAAGENPVALPVWLILGGIFFVDATVTLVRRLIRREPVYEAHRTHAYQRLASRSGSHLFATAVVLGLNLGLLLPCAALAVAYPRHAMYILAAVLAVLVPTVLLAGAGSRGSAAGRKSVPARVDPNVS